MKLIIQSWHRSEKETKGLESVGLKHGDVLKDPIGWAGLILEIYATGLNVMLAHASLTEPDVMLLGVSDDLFKQR